MKVLIVDDEPSIVNLIRMNLKLEGYDSVCAYSGREAVEAYAAQKPDIVLLDIMLPDTNGFEICQKIREHHSYPVIMLTAKDAEMDKITGLTLGADDYVTKPFRPLELVARVKAQLRRYKRYGTARPDGPGDALLVHSALELNTDTHECHLNGKPLNLTPTEFSILRILLERKGKAVSSEELFYEIWKDEYYNKNSNTITVHIRHLREKMGDTVEHPQYIKTIWGVGYKIDA